MVYENAESRLTKRAFLVTLGTRIAVLHMWWWEETLNDAGCRLVAVVEAAYRCERSSAPISLFAPAAASVAVQRFPPYQRTAGTRAVGIDTRRGASMPPDGRGYRSMVVAAGHPVLYWYRCDGLNEALNAAAAAWQRFELARIDPEQRVLLLLPYETAAGMRHPDGTQVFPLPPYHHAIHRNPN